MFPKNVDGVHLALIHSRLEGIARKMANTLLRTGRSGVLNTARDFSCCIVTRNDELLAAAESLPIHVLSGPDLMAEAMRNFHPNLTRGDAFLHNSPYHGCSHPADHTILVPVVDDAGKHQFTVLAKAHQADCGNSLPTTYMGSAQNVYEEGALIFPAVKVQSDYQNVEDIVRMIRLRIRVPDQWYGDFLAMMGAARIGERELLELGKELGWESIGAFSHQWLDYSEKRMDDAIRKMSGGRRSHCSTHDPFPQTSTVGIPITASVEVRPEVGEIEVDLRNNPDCMPCGLNLSEACARTAAMVGVFNSIDHTIPKNAGSFRRIKVLLREGCIAGIPQHPTSCSVATTNIADRVSNAVQCAIAELADGLGLAECGAVLPPGVGVISGSDPRSGRRFVNQVFLALGGGAGTPTVDAWQTIGHVGNGGMCFLDSVELDELHHPIYVHARGFIPDSEGAGRSTGGRSVFVEFGPIGCSMEISYVSDGTINGPKGVRGGLGGLGAKQSKRLVSGEYAELPACAIVTLKDGERVRSHSCGGGGYGRPNERQVTDVIRDVSEGWVSRERARDVYRVAIDGLNELDTIGTRRLRTGINT